MTTGVGAGDGLVLAGYRLNSDMSLAGQPLAYGAEVFAAVRRWKDTLD